MSVLRLLVCTGVMLTACQPQFVRPAVAPGTVSGLGTERAQVQSVALDTDSFISFDGTRLPLRRWLPPAAPKAVVIALHGFNDYSAFINMAAPFFVEKQLAVYAYDQRGFGMAPEHGRWPGKDAFAADLQQFVQLLRLRYPHTPLFILGESMGAAVILHAMRTGSMDVQGVILSAPAVMGWQAMPWWQVIGLKLAAHTIPWRSFTGASLGIVASDNRAMLLALGRDPLVIKATRVDAIYGLVNLMQAAVDAVPRLPADVPVLVLYGEKDQIIPKAAVLQLFGPGAGHATRLQLRIYKHGYHMLLRDLQAAVVWQDIYAWISNRPVGVPKE